MAGTGKPSIVAAAAFVVACGLAALAPTAAMAQIPFPMIPNFNFGPQHYRSSGSSHYSTRSRSHHEVEKEAPVDKTKEKDATQLEPPSNNAASGRQQLSAPVPSSQSDTATLQTSTGHGNDDQPAFQPSR